MPLFTTLLNYRYSAADTPERGRDADGIELRHAIERTNYPITLSIDDTGEGFAITAQVSAAIAPDRVCAVMQTAIEQLVAALADAPARPARQLDVLPPDERAQLIAGWNATAADYPRDAWLHTLFEA